MDQRSLLRPRRRLLTAGRGIALALLGACLSAQEDPAATYKTRCAECHGFDGLGQESLEAPALAGKPYWALKAQLSSFTRGLRGIGDDPASRSMRTAIEGFATRDLERIARWLSKLPPKPIENPVTELPAPFAKDCAACHGDRAEGKPNILAPPLAGMESWYFLGSVSRFHKGLRGGPEDDPGSQAMTPVIKAFTAAELTELAKAMERYLGK